ncbi:MAG: DUF1292 domain-containing protein [Clostridia bacterium]|nr:DUF1292 domain-containing protein [Clostridia bacterium]
MDDKKKNGCCCGHEDENEAQDCTCGCEDDEIVTLVSDDGVEQDFFTLATFDLEDKWYIVLEPATPVEGFQEGDVIIFRLEEDEQGEDVYQPIEDEAELEKAFAEFEKMLTEDVE